MHWVVHRVLPKGQCKQFCHRIKHNGEYISTISLLKGSATSEKSNRRNNRSATVNIFLHYLFSRVAQRVKRAIRVNKRSTTVNIFYDKNNATRPDKEELVNVRIQINITHDHIPDQVS